MVKRRSKGTSTVHFVLVVSVIIGFRFFLGLLRLAPQGSFFCSVLRQPFQALLDERADEATAARACLLRGVIQLADQTGGSTNRKRLRWLLSDRVFHDQISIGYSGV